MLLLRPPGVYRPQDDTDLLVEALSGLTLRSGDRVLDVGTGTGALAVAAVRSGATDVTAVDVSLRALAATWLNARLHRAPRAGPQSRRDRKTSPRAVRPRPRQSAVRAVSGQGAGIPQLGCGTGRPCGHRPAVCGRATAADRTGKPATLLAQSPLSDADLTLAALPEAGLVALIV